MYACINIVLDRIMYRIDPGDRASYIHRRVYSYANGWLIERTLILLLLLLLYRQHGSYVKRIINYHCNIISAFASSNIQEFVMFDKYTLLVHKNYNRFYTHIIMYVYPPYLQYYSMLYTYIS